MNDRDARRLEHGLLERIRRGDLPPVTKEEGRAPMPEATILIQIHAPQKLYDELKRLKAETGKSLDKMGREALERYVEEEKREEGQ